MGHRRQSLLLWVQAVQAAADSAPLQGAEAAALRRQLASLQQQLAVERQLSRAATREKADIDASLADLTRQVGLPLLTELQRRQEVRMRNRIHRQERQLPRGNVGGSSSSVADVVCYASPDDTGSRQRIASVNLWCFRVLGMSPLELQTLAGGSDLANRIQDGKGFPCSIVLIGTPTESLPDCVSGGGA